MPRLKLAVLAAIVLGILSTSPLAHADSIVLNGDFSQGSTGWTFNTSASSPWTFSGNGTYTYAASGCTSANCVAPDNNPHSEFLYQNLATTPGALYTLSFAYAEPGNPCELKVLFGNTLAADLASSSADGLTIYTLSGLVATSAITELQFLARSTGGLDQLTNVSVISSPAETPEPSTLVLLGTGAIGLYLVNRPRSYS